MSTISKERAELKAFITGFLTDPMHDDKSSSSLTAEVFRIALASLEAEPYGYVHKSAYEQAGSCGLSSDHEAYRDSSTHIAVYTAPPAPANAEPVAWLWSHRKHPSEVSLVRPEDDERAEGAHWSGWSCQALYAAPPATVSVPDAMEMDDDFDSAFEHGKAVGWNAYRAAMLHGSDGNAQVIPDGWVACSERMPDEGSKVIVFRPRAEESNDPPVKTATYKGGREYYHGFDCYCEPTHWMPLPAAPQQEVK